MKNLLSCILFLFAVSTIASAQSLQSDLVLKYLVQLPSQTSPHPPVIILLHGYGSDEKDLFELRKAFPANYIVVSARAPYTVPGAGYQWYELSKEPGKHGGKAEEVKSTRELIEKFMAQVITKYHADSKAVYLMGFSQGAIMSYEVGLTSPSRVKGIGILSGMVLETLKPEVKNTKDLRQLKIFIGHGTADQRIAYSEAQSSNDYLKKLGLDPDFHSYQAMGHSISNEELNDLVKWLK